MSADAPHHGPTHANVLRDGRVVGAWTCLRCRYQIANLKPDDRCPECGDPIAPSLDPTLLRFGPPETLQRIRLGARAITAAVIAGAASLPVLIFAINTLARSAWGTNATGSIFRDLVIGPFPAATLVYVMLFWFVRGVFLMTTPFPRTTPLPRSAAQLRWTLRAFAVLLPCLLAPLAYTIVMDSLGASTFLQQMHDAVPAAIFSSLLAVGVSLALGLSLYAWSIGGQTYLRGRPLRLVARAPSWFAILAASLAMFVLALVGPMNPVMEADRWGWFQWAFVSSIIAGVAFVALTLLSSLVVVDALRSCIKRDEREAFGAVPSSGSES